MDFEDLIEPLSVVVAWLALYAIGDPLIKSTFGFVVLGIGIVLAYGIKVTTKIPYGCATAVTLIAYVFGLILAGFFGNAMLSIAVQKLDILITLVLVAFFAMIAEGGMKVIKMKYA